MSLWLLTGVFTLVVMIVESLWKTGKFTCSFNELLLVLLVILFGPISLGVILYWVVKDIK